MCFFYESDEDWKTNLVPLIKMAIQSGDKVIYIYDEHNPENIKSLLKDGYTDEIVDNKLIFINAEEIYTGSKIFDPDTMIKTLIYETDRAISEGYPSLFITGEMTWALKGIEGSERLIEYERRLNEEFFGKFRCTGICQYNWKKFSAEFILDLIKTHSYILWKKELFKNVFFIEDKTLKEEDSKKKWLMKLLNSMIIEKEMEERIKELGKIIIDQPHIGFSIATDFPPKFLMANKGFEEILGFNEREIDFINQLYEQDRDLFIEEYKAVLEGDKQRALQRIRFVNKNGDLICLRMVITPIIFMDLNCAKICFVDVTEHWLKEEEMNKLREQFLFAQRMESIGRLAAGIAHDFNNVLTAIKGFTQLAQMKITENDPAKQYLTNIQSSAEKAEQLVKQLLAFSRKQILQPKVINLNDLIKSMEEMLKRLIGEDILLIFELSKDLGLVEADPAQMEQVILNLVVNAKDAMPQGGRIIIETSNVNLDEDYVKRHHGSKVGPHIMFAISDTGLGIPAEIKDKIFEPFFTTKEEKGTGLGLSTVYGIVKQHGGNIWVYSELNEGTTFKIYLPRVDKKLEQDQFEKGTKKLLTGTETILVIDDDEKVRQVLLDMLKRLGYKTLEAKDRDTAMFLAQFYHEPIHLVVADVVLPGISGVKLYNKIKNLRPNTKVLYISGYTDNVIVHHGILDKGIDFIQKPFSIEDISMKIREILDRQE
ncbi:MAG: MEDS domain-containing protein [Thermodesulfovibrio sp.]|nr:MEDS domain-containing protein [Thermodesulfovibrio sp.]